MHSFVDAAGRTWNVSLSCSAVRRIEQALKINIAESPQNGEVAITTRMFLNPVLFCDVLYCTLRPAADAQGLDSEAFGELLAGETLGKAFQAFIDEYVDFFQGQNREADAELARAPQTLLMQSQAEIAQRLRTIDLKAIVKSQAAALDSGRKSTASGASSGSTRGRTRTAN